MMEGCPDTGWTSEKDLLGHLTQSIDVGLGQNPQLGAIHVEDGVHFMDRNLKGVTALWEHML